MPASHSTSPPRFHRRRLVELGGVGLLGLSLPQMLQAAAATPGGRASSTEKSCIFIYQYGGLSQLDSWDPKPDVPEEIRGPYKPIATATPGLQVGELMPQLAKISDRYAVIRSLTHKVPVHDVANKMLLAGAQLPPSDAPSFGSVVSKLKPSRAELPSYVWLQKFGGGAAPPEPAYLSGGFLGMAHAPLVIGNSHDDNPAEPGFRVKAFDTAQDIDRARLDGRREVLSQLNVGASQAIASSAESWQRMRDKAFGLLGGAAARQAFDVEREPAAIRDRYGRHPLGQNLLMARRLIESGVRLVSVVAWTGLGANEKFVSVETWDMHGNAGISIFENGWNGLGFALPRCDQAVAALIGDLHERGLLDTTQVVLVGEFGRTPKISKGAKAIGRDHWPHCFSALVAGGGVRGGAVYGASDREAAYVKDHPVSLEDFTATLYHGLGIDPGTRLSPDGFTRPASTGEPIRELFG